MPANPSLLGPLALPVPTPTAPAPGFHSHTPCSNRQGENRVVKAISKQPVCSSLRSNERDHRAQKAHPPSPSKAPSKAVSPPENVPESELSKLCQEIAELREKFNNYIMSHEACCSRHRNSPSDSSEEEGKLNTTHPPPPLLVLTPNSSAEHADNPLPWLVAATSQQDLPTTFRDGIVFSSPLTILDSLPEGTLEVIKLNFDGTSPMYIGTNRDGELHVSTTAPRGMVTITYNLPYDPSVPMLPCRRK
ncbi:hypothetical protein EDC04DRAFT_2892267 [Pisolithus marmoratus]|nr:hypothetical protein EDC04DRAFT_2892267 [Pisolithus marmoratus]